MTMAKSGNDVQILLKALSLTGIAVFRSKIRLIGPAFVHPNTVLQNGCLLDILATWYNPDYVAAGYFFVNPNTFPVNLRALPVA